MHFMNDYDIEDAYRMHASHPVLGPAVLTLINLRDWTNANSDGWAYWPKPCRAAEKLMRLIEGTARKEAGENPGDVRFDTVRADATPAALTAALKPVRAFRTRQGADFEIVTADPDVMIGSRYGL